MKLVYTMVFWLGAGGFLLGVYFLAEHYGTKSAKPGRFVTIRILIAYLIFAVLTLACLWIILLAFGIEVELM